MTRMTSSYTTKNSHPRLPWDVADAWGKLIAPEGTALDPIFVRKIAGKGITSKTKWITLDNTTLPSQAAAVMREEVYRPVFSNVKVNRRLLDLIGRVRCPEGLYREILTIRRGSFFTYRHFVLVATLSARMAMDLRSHGLRPEKAFFYGLFHDIGKSRLPMRILNKKTSLTAQEYRTIHSYPLFSLLLLKYYLGKEGDEAVHVAYGHHEKLDGSGYPRGTRFMSPYTRLVAAIDIFDALVAKRPYRRRSFTVRGGLDKLIGEMHRGQMPTTPVKLLVSYFRAGQPYWRPLQLSLIPREKDPPGNSYGKILGRKKK